MSLEILECEQNSEEWKLARTGVTTASRFGDVLAKGEGKVRASYMRQLAGEIITGEPAEGYSNHHMERGHAMEAEARNLYALMTNREPRLVGFARNGRVGASPDSMLDPNGVLEIKSKLPALLIEAITRDGFPPEHKAQCQGALWVMEREFIDICIYWPKMPPVIYTAHRDEAYIKTLASEVDRFHDELDALVDRIKRYAA